MDDADSNLVRRAAEVGLPVELAGGALALAATVAGRDQQACRHYVAALAAGASPAALLEVARMAHLFGGFPRAIQGLRALADAFAVRGVEPAPDPEPGPRSREMDRPRGTALFRAIYREHADEVLGKLESPARGYSAWVLEDAYGRVLARPGLGAKERELLGVAALAMLRCPAQLKSHARGALALGARDEEIAALLELLAPELDPDALAEARRAVAPLDPRP